MIRRVHLAPNGRGLTVCGLVAARHRHRARWTAPPVTPGSWRCARCKRVILARRNRPARL